jgi:ribosomal protein S18 acetylase RimI-like enzyme
MNITLREAKLKDTPSVVRLITELAATGNEHSPITEAYVGKYLSSSVSKILLAEVQQHIVGLLSYSVRPDLHHAGDSCLIEELIVSADFRGQGVGSALTIELFARLATTDCAEVSVTTMPINSQAIKFYRSHGLIDEALYLEKHFR